MLTYCNSVPGCGSKATLERQNPEAAECWPLQCPSSASALSPPPPDDLIHLDSVPPVSAHLDNTKKLARHIVILQSHIFI